MDKKVLKKMQRFVELSSKFSKSESEVFPKDSKPLTRAEQILAEAHVKATLSDEFDEYNKLRAELSAYLDAHENLVK